MSQYTKEDISAVLHAAEILNKNNSGQKINISQFCKEAGISRKNAYKHKNKINISVAGLEQQIQQLEAAKEQIEQQLEQAQLRAREADLYWECRSILVALNRDNKKKGQGQTKKHRQLIADYNRISSLLGFEPLSCWG